MDNIEVSKLNDVKWQRSSTALNEVALSNPLDRETLETIAARLKWPEDNADHIPGKGNGQVCLLHGVSSLYFASNVLTPKGPPGTGKTFAVGMYYFK